jgi:hypothetical protein
MLNTSKDIVFVCKDEDVVHLIIKAAKLTKENILDREGRTSILHSEAIKETVRGSPKFTFFKYFTDIENNKELSKEWANSLFHLVANRSFPKYEEDIHRYFTSLAQRLPRQRGKIEKLRQELHLFIHNLWCVRAVILPTVYSRLPFEIVASENEINPETNKPKKIRKPIAVSCYPEILKIVHSPFITPPFNKEFVDHISESAINNLYWYAHRIIRAMDAWDLTDLNEDHIKAYRDATKETIGFAKSTVWLVALVDIYEKRLGFSSELINQEFESTSLSLKDNPAKWLNTEQAKLNPHHMEWEGYFKEYSDGFIESGYSSGHKLQATLRRAILEPLLRQNSPFPPVHEYSREHLGIMKTRLKERVASSTLDNYLRNAKSFLLWLEIAITGFKSPFFDKIDLPLARRRKNTAKVLAPEGSHLVMLTYNYAICEWIEYINFHADKNIKNAIIMKTNKKHIIDTEASGFTPIYRIGGEYRPIHGIPSALLSPIRVSENIKRNGALKANAIYPHTAHITALIMETGIRLIHCRWLDANTYGKPAYRPIINPKSYGVNKIHINTDKSHGPWDATVSDSVVSILDSQLKFRNTFLRGKDAPTWYDQKNNSYFGKIRPLFATTAPNHKQEDSFRVIGDKICREYFKTLIRTFSFEMLQREETLELALVQNTDGLDLLEFANDNSVKISVTPHSMRSQVVSDKITILPPDAIKEITGHTDDAHVIYYAQLKNSLLDTNEKAQADKFMTEIDSAITNTQTKESPLQQALRGDNLGAVLVEFGAVSFGNMDEKNQLKDGVAKLKKLNEESPFKDGLNSPLYFDSTHICPFGNQCPPDIVSIFNSSRKHCGECPYSIKTVDHIPVIAMKLRQYTDYLDEAQSLLTEAKNRKEPMSNMGHELQSKKYYANEIAAWTTTHSLLCRMANNLSKKDQWLVEKPEIISKQLSQVKATDELTLALVKINDAETSATYMTPQLKAQVSKLRKKLLISTKEYEKLMVEPEGYTLLNEFKGLISTVCQLSGISIHELAYELEKLPTGSTLALGLK